MNRRDFLRRSALVAAGAVAADQLELLDQLGWVRRFFPGWRGEYATATRTFARLEEARHLNVSLAEWDAMLRDAYGQSPIADLVHLNTPFLKRQRQPESLYQSTGRYIEVVRG